MSRAMQSLLFGLIYSIYLVGVMGPLQWLVIRPLCALSPGRRPRIMRTWLRLQAFVVLGLARSVGGMRLEIQGSIPAASCIVLMNHQSLLDIPVAVSLVRGPYPAIPTRARYGRGFPAISHLVHLAEFPVLAQGERATRAEHQAMRAIAEAVARGERSLILYPEGHRSRDGELQPFMTSGLKLVFRRAGRAPIYVIVVDGLWRLRDLSDIALRVSGTRAKVVVRGPFQVPAEDREHEAFILGLRAEMEAALRELRQPAAEPAAALSPQARARLAG